MLSGLGHCEDSACYQPSPSHKLVRLFRCSIHCDRLLCLYHLNAHNIYYEEEKKQNDVVLNELQNNLTLYQTIFEQHLQEYRELVHQASSLLLHNTSSIVPIEQIRPVLEKLQRTIAAFRQEKVIIKNESLLDTTELDIEKMDSNFFKDIPLVKKELTTPIKNRLESSRVVVRLQRIDFPKETNYELRDEQINKKDEYSREPNDADNNIAIESIRSIADEDVSHILRPCKVTDENQPQDNKRSQFSSPASTGKKKYEKMKKKNEKIIPLKRLQT